MYTVVERKMSPTDERRYRAKLKEIDLNPKFQWSYLVWFHAGLVILIMYMYFSNPDLALVTFIIGAAFSVAITWGLNLVVRDARKKARDQFDSIFALVDGRAKVVEHQVVCERFAILEACDDETETYFLDVGDGKTLILNGSVTYVSRFPSTDLRVKQIFDRRGKLVEQKARCMGVRIAPTDIFQPKDSKLPFKFSQNFELLERPYEDVTAELYVEFGEVDGEDPFDPT